MQPELALDHTARALDDKLPGQTVLADGGDGDSVELGNGFVAR